jgi:elongation factor P
MSVLSYNEISLKKVIIWNNEPHVVLASHVFRKQQRKPVNITKLKSLISGRVVEQTFHQNDTADEADIETRPIEYLYSNRGEYWFITPGKPAERFSLPDDIVGDEIRFLKPKSVIDAILFDERIIGIKMPIKAELKVTEAMEAVKGNTSSGALKEVTLETGAKVMVPMFINEGDIVKINTETGEYTERMEKA